MIVVFDTNVWKSELYLQSPSAAAVRFFLREQKARRVETISEQLLRGSRERLVAQLATNGFSLGEITDAERKLFATENPRLIFVESQVAYECPELTNAGRSPSHSDGEGGRYLRRGRAAFRDETIKFRGEDGSNQEMQHSFLYAEGFVIGQKEVKNMVRYAIREQSA